MFSRLVPTSRHSGPESDHFDGQRFQNLVHLEHAAPMDFLRWQLTRRPGEWQRTKDDPPGPPPPERVGKGELRVTFINHATVLVQIDGVNLLTDPVWSERISPVSWLGPRRMRPPGIRFDDLPPIDVVLISHNHYDHLDLPTLSRLAAVGAPKVITGLGNASMCARAGFTHVEEIDWWQRAALPGGLGVCGVPAQHFSGRGLNDRDATLWMGFMLESSAGSVYFAGDTGFGPHFELIRQRLGSPRLALLPIGAYLPRWFMGPVHMDPEDAVMAHRVLGAHTSLGIHFGTFRLTDEAQEAPVRALEHALGRLSGAPPRFWVLDHGEGRWVPPVDQPVSSRLSGEST